MNLVHAVLPRWKRQGTPAPSAEGPAGIPALNSATNEGGGSSMGGGMEPEQSRHDGQEHRSLSSHAEILKSSALIGGSTLVTVVISAARTKAIAVLLGPSGFGLMGLMTSVADLACSVAEMGINSSGVRQIAAANAKADEASLARTTRVLRLVAALLGLLGALFLLLLAVPVSILTFGSAAQAGAIMLLSTAVFLRLLSDGQRALLQGVRRIGDLARCGIYGSLLGALLGIPLIALWKADGIVPALIAMAFASLLASWYYSRRVPIDAGKIGFGEFREEAAALLGLGIAFMGSTLLMMGNAYLVRIIVLRHSGLEAAGLYQSAWTLAGLYVGFILQAMGSDFYPRLVAVAQDARQCNRLVNEQTHVGLLLAGPGGIFTLAVAPWVLHAFYSEQFLGASNSLRWFCLGMALRVVSWPMGFIIMAKARQKIFIATELAWTAVSLALSWFLVQRFGLTGAGVAFFGSYAFHIVMLYFVTRRMIGFSWTASNWRLILMYVAATSVVIASLWWMPLYQGQVLALVIAALCALHSFRSLRRLLSSDAGIGVISRRTLRRAE